MLEGWRRVNIRGRRVRVLRSGQGEGFQFSRLASFSATGASCAACPGQGECKTNVLSDPSSAIIDILSFPGVRGWRREVPADAPSRVPAWRTGVRPLPSQRVGCAVSGSAGVDLLGEGVRGLPASRIGGFKPQPARASCRASSLSLRNRDSGGSTVAGRQTVKPAHGAVTPHPSL